MVMLTAVNPFRSEMVTVAVRSASSSVGSTVIVTSLPLQSVWAQDSLLDALKVLFVLNLTVMVPPSLPI